MPSNKEPPVECPEPGFASIAFWNGAAGSHDGAKWLTPTNMAAAAEKPPRVTLCYIAEFSCIATTASRN
jgi:hypothetical protein